MFFPLPFFRHAWACILLSGAFACTSTPSDTGDTDDPAQTLCAENEAVTDHTCVPCAQGTSNEAGDPVQGEDTSCDPCDPGTYDPGDYTCIPCDAGFISEAAAATCTPCDAGTYESENQCLECPEDFTSAEGSIECVVASIEGRLDVRDYGYLFWPGNHWYTWNVFEPEQQVHTGFYGLTLNVTEASISALGIVHDELTAEEALAVELGDVTDLAPVTVNHAIVVDGKAHAATSFAGTDGSTTNPSRIIDMGRFMQRVDIPVVGYTGARELTGSVQLAAMPRHFVLTHRVTSTKSASSFQVITDLLGESITQYPETEWLEEPRALSIHNSDGEGWAFILPEQAGSSAQIQRSSDGSLTFQRTFADMEAGELATLSIIAIPSNAHTESQLATWLDPADTVTVETEQLYRDGSTASARTLARWDPERGLYEVTLGNLKDVGAGAHPNWAEPTQHNWYNRHRIHVHNHQDEPLSIPLAFHGGNNAAFYITGGSPLFRDTDGEPMGAPVQISKNWHETPFWYHLYSALELAPGSHEFELTFAHSKWGTAHAAAHAQLSLIGWGVNQQWDESSLGAFGETITYDPDLTLGRSMVDDVRPLLVDAKGKWAWTGNVGGANFLLYANEDTDNRPEHQLGRLRTHYAFTGPNLTNVTYAGVTRDGKIEAQITTQLGRTDDLVRVYYHVEYHFLEEASYDRLALFQMAADRYGDNDFSRHAYGNADVVLFDAEVPNHKTTGYASASDRGIPLTGDAPWVMLYDNLRTGDALPERLANVAFVVRDYQALIGGTETRTPHINIWRTYNAKFSQMSFELGLPFDPDNTLIPAGSTLKATIEYLVPPSDKGTYYGESDWLTAHPADSFQSTDMALRLASGNQLEVTPTTGTLIRTYPVELYAAPGGTAVEFTLSGGLGYTPVTITGLARPEGWRLEENVDGAWAEIDQAVEGNDYWQAYDDPSTHTYTLVFNVHNRGTREYRLIRPM